MKPHPLVIAGLLLFAAACASNSPVALPVTEESVDTPAATLPEIDRARQCVSTDPGWRPISVHRALNCPDGTTVTVQGILVHDADGSVTLCDVVTPTRDRCVGAGLTIEGAAPSPVLAASVDKVFYTGVVSGHVLTTVGPSDVPVVAAPQVTVFSRPSAPLRSA